MTPFIEEKITVLLSKIQEKDLKEASKALTQLYQKKQISPSLSQNLHFAYLAVRMPATYAVVLKVFSLLKSYPLTFFSYLDLGAGPGTAAIAWREVFPEVKKITLIEQDTDFLMISKYLLEDKEAKDLFEWKRSSIETTDFPTTDFIGACYSLGEVKETDRYFILEKMWHKSMQGVIIIEPGTPQGYETILEVRKFLIEKGAYILAPCPHHHQCPLKEPDWCHFSEKLQRSSLHRRLKAASLGFEDEKYSFIIATHEPFSRPSARILRPPLKRSGHVTLDLCTENGVKRKTFSRRESSFYRQARKVRWGEGWEDSFTSDHEF